MKNNASKTPATYIPEIHVQSSKAGQPVDFFIKEEKCRLGQGSLKEFLHTLA